MKRTTPDLAAPLQSSALHQREDVWPLTIWRAAGPIHDGSSVESGFEPGAFRIQENIRQKSSYSCSTQASRGDVYRNLRMESIIITGHDPIPPAGGTSRHWSGVIVMLNYFCNAYGYHHEVLDHKNRFHLFWKVDNKHEKVIFRIEVETKGYVALGLSPNGGMPGSDIAIGWVKNGKVYLQDRHAYKNAMPVLDDQQDWQLLHGYENDTHTVLQFSRKFDTCDEQDLAITNDTMRVIYAYHDADYLSDEMFLYHGKDRRGSRSLLLLQPVTKKNQLPDDAKIWNIRLPNITIPDDTDTTYWCKIVKAPPLNKKHHVIQVCDDFSYTARRSLILLND
ncbi:DBH-like monooxygenase protein 1 [Araneus ventricosus]|uniref:DBH-like monooxygenase protein 1 n=1 Tax=Araneus ventricosus TaxID=182803 RepID=A0A4Y2H114_ARAVE|nr:DBH-like monooxygenase protein 1 [Araneus ventricosus]